MRGWRSAHRVEVLRLVADEYERLTPALFGAIARDLIELIELPAEGLVLDIGTGTGVAAAATAAMGSGNVVGVDPSVPMLEVARGRARLLVAGVAPGLPFPDDTVDAVAANLVLSHFRDTAEGAAELVRVLRPGGRLGVTAWPEDRDEPESEGKEAGALIQSALANAGLTVEPPAAEKAARGEAWLKEVAIYAPCFPGPGSEISCSRSVSTRSGCLPATSMAGRYGVAAAGTCGGSATTTRGSGSRETRSVPSSVASPMASGVSPRRDWPSARNPRRGSKLHFAPPLGQTGCPMDRLSILVVVT